LLGEKELCSLLAEHPEKGLVKMMDQYAAFVYAIVYGKLSGVCDKRDIEECVSDIFYKVYLARNLIDLGAGSLKSYLAVLSKRTAIDFYRKKRVALASVPLDESGQEWIASDADVEKAAIDGEARDALIQGIKALGEPDSQIMIRKYYFGQTSKAISKAMGIKENTINKRVSRALLKLKEALGGIL
jgi:RNA polymerase sigma-70 factor (ECF subfamily)